MVEDPCWSEFQVHGCHREGSLHGLRMLCLHMEKPGEPCATEPSISVKILELHTRLGADLCSVVEGLTSAYVAIESWEGACEDAGF